MYLSYYVIYIKSHECLFGLRKNADVYRKRHVGVKCLKTLTSSKHLSQWFSTGGKFNDAEVQYLQR